ncbi:beta-microseminoprotein [Sciurus carolinensis]|uniref:beta-microseminoprotein n=1 Tax=Sciurus carolinensis TaxID=30640 RepID=UPI001FB36EF2|nr:beta-microseminoprotein [Sciurus carolinensis]
MRILKALLASLMVLSTFVTSSNAQCYLIDMENAQECKDADGVTHVLNSKWKNEKCEDCFCTQRGISCCSSISVPVGFDNDKCEKVFHKSSCSYTVVEKNNPEKPCPIESWIA